MLSQTGADYGYEQTDILVVGDDLDSEIKAGLELGLLAIHYSKGGVTSQPVPYISDFSQLAIFIEN